MKKFFPIFFLIPFFTNPAQNLDSLFNEFLRIKGAPQFIKPQIAASETKPIKCGFGTVNEVKLNYDKFSSTRKTVLSSTLQRPAADTSFVTPSNKFRIHFKKTGFDAPQYDLKELAKAADSSYNYEVNILGYPPPPNDFGEGGDDRYDIYIQNLAGGLYGYTETDKQIGENTFTAFTVIDNDFGANYYSRGIYGARVTIAHELHHAIQIGNYIYRPSDNFYYEITSTAMEEFVYNSINDYYNYMDSYFRNPSKAFSSNNGYNLAIWNLFLRDRFGVDIIKRTWELMKQKRAIEAIADAIQNEGSIFKVEFNKFGQWTYFTGYRAVQNKYFEEAANYPLIKPLMITDFTPPTLTMDVSSEAVSNNFLLFNNNSTGTQDVFVSLVSNCDIAGGVSSPVSILPFTYTLSSQQFTGGRKIFDGYYSKIESVSSFLLSESNILNNILINDGQIASEEIDFAFPQPFSYSTNSQIFFPATISGDGTGWLYIYSIDMNLVYSAQKRIVATDKIVVGWDARDENKSKLSTGVYFYVTKSGDKIKKGKFVIYND